MKTLNWKNLVLGAFLLGGAAVQTGCSVGVSGGGYVYHQPWYDVWGDVCGYDNPAPGCNFYSDGYKIVDYEDPYYSSAYYDYGIYDYYNSFGELRTYVGLAWLSPNGILYDDYGNALNSKDGKMANKKQSSGRNLYAAVAKEEAELTKTAAMRFAAKYSKPGDSEATKQALVAAGMRVAKTLKEFDNIAKVRNRTTKDVLAYAEKALGVKGEVITKALASAEKGDLSGIVAANEEVAKSWHLSPSRTKEVLKTWFSKEASQVGIQ